MSCPRPFPLSSLFQVITPASKIGVLILCVIPATAQSVVSAQAGLIQFTQGDVYIDARPVQAVGKPFLSLKDGQVLRTGRGRVEVLVAPAIFLWLGPQGSLRLVNNSLEDTRVELDSGTALIEVVELVKGGRIYIEQGETRTEFKGAGLYRFESDRHQLLVFGGAAEVRVGERTVSTGRGRAVQLSASLSISRFNRKRVDELHQWAASRSFQSFESSAREGWWRTDWEITFTGWFWNRDFEMKFLSAIVADEYRRMQAAEERKKAPFEPPPQVNRGANQ